MTQKPLLVLFDGNAVVHRAYHAFQATRPLTITKTGEPVSAVYGFALMLLKVIKELKPTHYAVAFDKAAPTFRHKMFEEYKAHRPKTPEDLSSQIGRVKQLVEAFRIPVFELEGFEADDILGTLSLQASKQDIDTIIITGDADVMQLVSPHVSVLYPKAGRAFSDTNLFDEASVLEKYGVKPENIADLKGLVGDTSDNIPGVQGIGDKTAVKLIQQFGPVEQIYARINEVEPPRLQAVLKENESIARQSKELATIVTDVPVKLDLDLCRASLFDRNQVAELLRELEFTSLLSKLPEMENAEETVVAGKPPEGDYRTVSTMPALDELAQKLKENNYWAFDIETTSLDPMSARLVGLSFAVKPGEAFYVPVGHAGLLVEQIPMEQALARLRPVLEDAGIAKVSHSANYDVTVLAEHGLNVRGLSFDTMVAAHLLGEKSLTLKGLAFARLGIEMPPITDIIGNGAKQIPMSHADVNKVANYACADVDMTLQLAALLGSGLREQGLWGLFTDVEMPLVPVLIGMQRAGVAIDRDLLGDMSREIGAQITKLEAEIYNAVGHQFNINSPQQLSRVLFDDLKLGTSHRGKRSTDSSVLDELHGTHPVIGFVQEYRQLSKLKSTYIDALPAVINSRTGRLHSSFNQTRTATGRLSSSDPNLQNIPVRGELGRQIRRAFIAPPGCLLLAGDYSQIDLRVLAHLSKDPGLVAAFQKDEDIHAATAAQLFNVAVGEVNPDMRRLAKTVNFGVIYGMSEFGLEQATELSREDAGKFITAYFEKYPAVRQYLDSTKDQARKTGYVQTLLGRRRYIPEINSPNRILREAAERMAINMPVQGTSADIIKVAMIKLDRQMAEEQLKSRMVLQVHDELIFEVPEAEMDTMRAIVPQVMANALTLNVPIKVDTKVGSNWGEME